MKLRRYLKHENINIFLLVGLLFLFVYFVPFVACAQEAILQVPPEDVMQVSSFEDLYNGLSRQIREHKDVAYYDTNLKFEDISDGFYRHYNEKEPLLSGMYMAYYLEQWEVAWWTSTRPVFSDHYNYRYEIKMDFRCSAQELNDFFVQMKELAQELRQPSEYESVKAVHDYIIKNVTYDKSLTNHLDLEGFRDHSMVCSGYAMAMFHLLINMGIDCRIVSGTADSKKGVEDHAWNVVKVDGSWYNLDATWDDLDNRITPLYYKYFLKSDSDFPLHARADRFDGYMNSISTVSYPEPIGQKAIGMIAWNTQDGSISNLIYDFFIIVMAVLLVCRRRNR